MPRLPVVYDFEETGRQAGAFGERELRRMRFFKAHTSDLIGAEDALYRHDQALKIGAVHPSNSDLFVSSFLPTQAHDNGYNSRPNAGQPKRYLWSVAVEYSNLTADILYDPTEKPVEISGSTLRIVKAITKDNRGNLIVNTAGSLIEDLNEEFHLWQFRFRKNVRNFPTWARQYPGAVNSDSVRFDNESYDPRTLKLDEMDYGPQQSYGAWKFRELNFSLIHNEETWDRLVLNRGVMELQLKSVLDQSGAFSTVKTLTPILDDDGQPVAEPQFLNEDGVRPMVSTETGLRIPKYPLDPEDIITLKFETRKKLPFRQLPLR